MPRILVLVVLGGVYAAAVQTVLLLPGDNPVPTAVWLTAFVGALAALAASVVVVKSVRGRRGRGLRTRQSRLPKAAAIGLLATYVAAAIAVLVMTAATGTSDTPPGQPEITADGQYALNNHGALTFVTRAQYLHAAEVGQRGFVGFALVFYVVAGLMIAFSVDWSTPVRARSRDDAVS